MFSESHSSPARSMMYWAYSAEDVEVSPFSGAVGSVGTVAVDASGTTWL